MPPVGVLWASWDSLRGHAVLFQNHDSQRDGSERTAYEKPMPAADADSHGHAPEPFTITVAEFHRLARFSTFRRLISSKAALMP